MVLAPDFNETDIIVITYAKPVEGGSVTAAAKMTLSDDMSAVSDVTDIFVQSPASPTTKQYGSRVVVLPDGNLAITVGERSSDKERVYAQDLDKTYGKVVRVTMDGDAVDGNPFIGQAGATRSGPMATATFRARRWMLTGRSGRSNTDPRAAMN